MYNFIQNIIDFFLKRHIIWASGQSNALSFNIINPLSFDGNLGDILNRLMSVLLMFGAPIAIIMYLWAGFQFLTSGGQPDKVKQANQTILWTTVGLAVIIMSQAIIFVVQSILA